MENIFLYVHQLPQNIVGYLVKTFSKAKYNSYFDVYVTKKRFNVSLGKYIIVNNTDQKTVKHEHGHQKQSLYLGWLYLLVIGIPSGIGCLIWTYVHRYDYFSTWWEAWADKLGGVKR